MTLADFLMLAAFIVAGGPLDMLCGRHNGNVFDFLAPIMVACASWLFGIGWLPALGMGLAWAAWRAPAWRWPPTKAGLGILYVKRTQAHALAAAQRHAFSLAFVIPLYRVWYVAIPCVLVFIAWAVYMGIVNEDYAAKGHNVNSYVETSRGWALHAMLAAPLMVLKLQATL